MDLPKPAGATSLTTNVCVDPQNVMLFHVDWANETIIDQAQNLIVTWTLQGGGQPTTQIAATFAFGTDPTSFADWSSTVVVGPKGPINWNRWRTIGVTASGAFTDASANAIRRPGGSWPAC